MDGIQGIEDTCPGTTQAIPAQLFLALIKALFVSQSTLSPERNNMYPEDYGPSLADGDEFDFIVVGAGSAGSVVASRLSENKNWKVLLLEAGGIPSAISEIPALFFSAQYTEKNWKYSTEPTGKACLAMKNQRCLWPRAKELGGCSSINAMLYVRGCRKDFDEWAAFGNTGWDYDSVKSYFERVELLKSPKNSTLYGHKGKVSLQMYDSGHPLKHALKKAARSMGYEAEDVENLQGFFEIPITVENGQRHSASKAYLMNNHRQNLLISLNSVVSRVIINKITNTAKGVEVTVGNRPIKLKARKEIVLSGGSINSPVLLMNSGVGPEEHLKQLNIDIVQNLPVGLNLQDHACHLGLLVKLDDTAVEIKNAFANIFDYLMHRQGSLSNVDITNLVGFINTKNISESPNIQYHNILYAKNDNYLLPTLLYVVNFEEAIVNSLLNINKESNIIHIISTLLKPKSLGRVMLKSSDPFEKPVIHANYLNDDDDVQVLLESIKFVEKLFKMPPLARFNPQILPLDIPNCRHLQFKSDEYWICNLRNTVTTLYHPVGTCKMGPAKDTARVVTPNLEVVGIRNIRVADASVMPTITSANTNAPSLMIGEKAADLIRKKWITSLIPAIFFSTQHTAHNWKYCTEPSDKACLGMKHQRCMWPRGRGLGGSGAINAMMYVRGCRRDFDEWAELGNIGWDYDSIVPYFERVEQLKTSKNSPFYGRQGKVSLQTYDIKHLVKYALKDSASTLGYAAEDHENLQGFFEIPINVKNGERYSASKAYLTNNHRKNLLIAMDSFVKKVLIDNCTKTAEGVEVKIGNRSLKLKAKKEVVLSGGSINSPVVLMNSGVGPEEHLKQLKIDIVQNLPVGFNLQDHAIFTGMVIKIDEAGLEERNSLWETFDYFMHRQGALSNIGMANFVGFINTRNNSNYPNVQYMHAAYLKNDFYLLPAVLSGINYEDVITNSYLDFNKEHSMIHLLPTLLKPQSRGRIMLRSSDPFENPVIHANYLDHDDEVQILLEGIKFAEKLLETAAIKRYNPEILPLDIPNCRNLKFKSDSYWRCSLRNMITTVYHPVGTCKMGPADDPTRVVSPNLQVIGIKNLRVVDASVMPTIPSANTNAAALMVGEKGADLIKTWWTEA